MSSHAASSSAGASDRGESAAATTLDDFVRRVDVRLRDEVRKILDHADENDDDGGHVGVSSYYRNVARGLGDARTILTEEARRVGS